MTNASAKLAIALLLLLLGFGGGWCVGSVSSPRTTARAVPLFVERTMAEIVRVIGISPDDVHVGDGRHPLLALKTTIIPWWMRSPQVRVMVDEWLFGLEEVTASGQAVHADGNEDRVILTTSTYRSGSGSSSRGVTVALWVEHLGS
jgi:hypothetical protein